MESLEYLYWLDNDGHLHHYINTYRHIIFACKASGATAHWCYAPAYQFSSDWIVYNREAGVQSVIEAKYVPAEVKALHLLIYRG